jgi:beta-hydroxylase
MQRGVAAEQDLRVPTTAGDVFRVLRDNPDMRPLFLIVGLLKFPEFLIGLTKDAKRTFFDPDQFPWVKDVEVEWPAIRKELDARLQHLDQIPAFQEVQREQRFLSNDNRWKTYIFHGYGARNEHNCAECPRTAAALEKIPGMKTAFFSILDAGKELPPHRGPYKGVLRYHLGLRIPATDSRCAIRVGNDVRTWQEGKSLVFDDSHNHEAWNRTDQLRVVLFVDFLRPLPFPLSMLNRVVVSWLGQSGFVQGGMRKLEEWNEKLDATKATKATR